MTGSNSGVGRAVVVALFLFSAVAVSETTGRVPQSSQAAKLNAELGVAYLQRGNVALAQEKIDKALAENSADADVQTAAALLYDHLGDVNKASDHYQAAIHADPNDPNRQNNYAAFLCRRGSYERGQKLLEDTARNRRYATPEVALTNAGVCARSGKDATKAENDFKRALEINPNYADALLQLADLNYARGDLLNARIYLSRLMASAPPSAEQLLLGVKIERAANDPRAEREYGDKLRHDFPDSPQAREIDGAMNP